MKNPRDSLDDRCGTTRRTALKLALAFAAAGIGARLDAAPAAGAPVRIGSTLALTGPLAQTALLHKVSAEVAVEQINLAGGLLGRPIEWVLYDDQSKPEVARSLYEKLITADKVDLLIGPYATSGILAAAVVAQRHGKLLVHYSLGIPSLVTYDMAFPATPFGPEPNKTLPAKVFDLLARSKTPPRSVAFVASKFPSVQFVTNGAKKVAEERGLSVVLDLEYDFGTRDFGAIAARVKEANADFLWAGAIGPEGSQLLESLKKLDYQPPRQYQLYPSPAIAAVPEAKNALSVSFIEDHEPFTSDKEFVKFGSVFHDRAVKAGLPYPYVEGQAVAQYVSWQILAAAVNSTKSLEDKVLAAWLRSNTVPTMHGPLQFNKQYNQGEDLTKVRQLLDGKWTIVWPSEFAPPGRTAQLP
ncbi:amino acid ABC transporter substrate-binding protein [Bradyrhizobium sp. SSUT18]|uniref:amino acid ABC transporter substrate-binding protein n=1 Tax=Bradyrhizobium sp. SSUT18 TaxID=3040602 RepID=UPI00244B1D99|nr:amino acid ABC transporter substrate-binding protein [Bradyrhizobium sp. SSUT18]MDH2401821.1 amino acid ABC transporter substrate-binding protein [Bradyrhizobium sp. SSUT18]